MVIVGCVSDVSQFSVMPRMCLGYVWIDVSRMCHAHRFIADHAMDKVIYFTMPHFLWTLDVVMRWHVRPPWALDIHTNIVRLLLREDTYGRLAWGGQSLP